MITSLSVSGWRYYPEMLNTAKYQTSCVSTAAVMTHWIFGNCIWIRVLPFGVENVVPASAVIGDAEPHIFKFWYYEDVRNPFLVEPMHNEVEVYFTVGGCIPCITISKHPSVSFSHIHEELFIVHLILRGVSFPGRSWLSAVFVLLGILVHQHGNFVLWIFMVFNHFTILCVDLSTLLIGCA